MQFFEYLFHFIVVLYDISGWFGWGEWLAAGSARLTDRPTARISSQSASIFNNRNPRVSNALALESGLGLLSLIPVLCPDQSHLIHTAPRHALSQVRFDWPEFIGIWILATIPFWRDSRNKNIGEVQKLLVFRLFYRPLGRFYRNKLLPRSLEKNLVRSFLISDSGWVGFW